MCCEVILVWWLVHVSGLFLLLFSCFVRAVIHARRWSCIYSLLCSFLYYIQSCVISFLYCEYRHSCRALLSSPMFRYIHPCAVFFHVSHSLMRCIYLCAAFYLFSSMRCTHLRVSLIHALHPFMYCFHSCSTFCLCFLCISHVALRLPDLFFSLTCIKSQTIATGSGDTSR